ncbi:Bax inhibitor-1/YccA family protein [Microvirga arsenatis]|uniref:BAX inhibitor (BI)-1/YccA family protein n=1 Tax=Microvirga arsenatis TaxID=2692265 RepID=A0ABW9Z381_9HYPH|nr:Bax inhibitor-1/YccA family protein [Microvirga arsenatis]NBJ13657.1 BAX inhibitor (BI)-1/YccA family protein [Microvirga arsenatis]NBJ27144.1 BAX inhibitor (BI)-1/YccA family protein [Microvirga arsenatis]
MSRWNDNSRLAPYGFGPGTFAPARVEFDAGLRAHMIGVYNYLMLGLALSGAVAYTVTNTSLGELFYSGPRELTPLGWVALLAPLGLVLIASFGAQSLSPAGLQGIYWGITALQGIGLAALLQAYTGESVTRVFFITAACFGALSLWGYTTRSQLSGWGSFLLMGLVGLILASVVNLFLASSALQFTITVIGLFVFAGLTAWDTQRIKEEYVAGLAHGDAALTSRVFGALSLYLNFLNLFQLLLSLLGQREE